MSEGAKMQYGERYLNSCPHAMTDHMVQSDWEILASRFPRSSSEPCSTATTGGRSGFWTKRLPSSTSNTREYSLLRSLTRPFANSNIVMCRYEHGIQTFDTADVYSNGVSERILGNAIKQLGLRREEIVIMTKVRVSNTVVSVIRGTETLQRAGVPAMCS